MCWLESLVELTLAGDFGQLMVSLFRWRSAWRDESAVCWWESLADG